MLDSPQGAVGATQRFHTFRFPLRAANNASIIPLLPCILLL
jgi:hypothetical protein